jgi:hypothetical protein
MYAPGPRPVVDMIRDPRGGGMSTGNGGPLRPGPQDFPAPVRMNSTQRIRMQQAQRKAGPFQRLVDAFPR